MRLWCAGVLVLVAVATLPSMAVADARHYPGLLGRPGGSIHHGGRSGHFPGAHFQSGHFHGGHGHRHHDHHHRRHAGVVIFPGTLLSSAVLYAAPPVVYAPPPVYAAPPTFPYTPYAPPNAYWAPPVSAPPSEAIAPPPPPAPRVVEFDTGRYELRGDGVRDPYIWVWVPRAPAAPPGEPAPRHRAATVYRWVDENGVTTFTDDPGKVPTRFRATEITPRP